MAHRDSTIIVGFERTFLINLFFFIFFDFSTKKLINKPSLLNNMDEKIISKKECELVKKLIQASDDRNLFGSEKELFEKIKDKSL